MNFYPLHLLHFLHRLSSVVLLGLFCAQLFCLPASALDSVQALPNAEKRIQLKVYQLPVAQVLQAVAGQAGFNIVLDESLNSQVSVDFHRTRVVDVLQALKTMGNLYYQVEGKTLYVTTNQSSQAEGIRQQQGHLLHVRHLPAVFVANLLNETVFAHLNPPQTGGGAGAGGGAMPQAGLTATADPMSNTVLLNCDLQAAEQAAKLVDELDIPRQQKTWHLNHVRADEAAVALSSTVFANGSMPLVQSMGGAMGGGGGGAGAGMPPGGGAAGNVGSVSVGGPPMPLPIPVQQEVLQDGSGTEAILSNGGNQTAGTTKQVTLRERVLNSGNLSVNSNGPILLPDSRVNTITILGTPQQLAQAGEFIAEFDRQRKQVYLELAVIELSDDFDRIFSPSVAATFGGNAKINVGFNANLNGLTTGGYTKNPIQNTKQFNAVLNFLQTQGKLNIVARPSVATLHDEEANISIVDEVVQGFSNVRDQNNNIVARVANITGAGITLNILPRVAANGDVSLRVNPIISFPQPNPVGNIQLISQRELVAQNIILEQGQSFILGGLKQHLSNRTTNKIPVLGNIPVLNGLAKTLDSSRVEGELLIMITPHLIDTASGQPQRLAPRP